MEQDLVFPRLVYRGEADTLGTGIVGETQRIDSADALKAAIADGWRLTRHDPAEAADDAAAPPTSKKAAKK